MSVLRWGVQIFLIISGIGAAICTFLVATSPAELASGLRIALLVFAIMTLLLGVVQKIIDQQAIRLRAREVQALRKRFYEVFDGPLGRQFGLIARMIMLVPGAREKKIDAIRHNTVRMACQLITSNSARASYFRVDSPLAPTRVMTCSEYNYSDNRADDATTEFVETADADREVWDVLDGRTGPAIFSNLETVAPVDWDQTRRVYKGFMTYRIHVDSVGVGVLTVNSLVAEEFGGADESLMSALAELLSLAETAALGPKERNAFAKGRPSAPMSGKTSIVNGGKGTNDDQEAS